MLASEINVGQTYLANVGARSGRTVVRVVAEPDYRGWDVLDLIADKRLHIRQAGRFIQPIDSWMVSETSIYLGIRKMASMDSRPSNLVLAHHSGGSDIWQVDSADHMGELAKYYRDKKIKVELTIYIPIQSSVMV